MEPFEHHRMHKAVLLHTWASLGSPGCTEGGHGPCPSLPAASIAPRGLSAVWLLVGIQPGKATGLIVRLQLSQGPNFVKKDGLFHVAQQGVFVLSCKSSTGF